MKLLICSLNSFGFLNPFIGLAKELISQGHEIAFVCDTACEDVLVQEGLTRIPNGAGDLPSFQVERFAQKEHSVIQTQHVLYALRHFSADIILTNPLAYGALIAARQTNTKVVCMGFLSYLWETPEKDKSSSQKMLDLYAWRTRDQLRLFQQALQINQQDSAQSTLESLPFIGDLLLHRATPSLFTRRPYCPDNISLVGSCLWESQRDSEHRSRLLSWLQQNQQQQRPMIFVNHGRTFQLPRFWDVLKESFKNSDYLVVANVGRMDGRAGDIPDNFYVQSYIPQNLALSSANLVIANGNSTATLGALEHGIPMLLLPGGGETVDNADLCSGLGVANSIEESRFSTELLRSNVEQLLDDQQVAQQCQNIKSEMQSYQGFKKAAQAVLACA